MVIYEYKTPQSLLLTVGLFSLVMAQADSVEQQIRENDLQIRLDADVHREAEYTREVNRLPGILERQRQLNAQLKARLRTLEAQTQQSQVLHQSLTLSRQLTLQKTTTDVYLTI